MNITLLNGTVVAVFACAATYIYFRKEEFFKAYRKARSAIDFIRLLTTIFKERRRLSDEKSEHYHRKGIIYYWDKAVEQFAHKDFVVASEEGGKSYSFLESDRLANKVANALMATFGFDQSRKGHTIPILLCNEPFYVICCLGIWKAGLCASLLNNASRGKSLAHILRLSFEQNDQKNKNVLIIDFSYLDKLEYDDVAEVLRKFKVAVSVVNSRKVNENVKGISFVSMDDILSTSSISKPEYINNIDWARDKALIMFTSGTTGLPKAAPIGHKRLFGGGQLLKIFGKTSSNDRLYCVLPLYHSVAMLTGVASCIFTGSSLVIRKKFSASNFAREIFLNQCTIFLYIGELARYVLHANVNVELSTKCKHTLRLAFGVGMRADVWKKFQSTYDCEVMEYYGSTEGNALLVNNVGIVGACGYLPNFLSKIYKLCLVQMSTDGEVKRDPVTNLALLAENGKAGQLLGKIASGLEFTGYTDSKSTEKKIVRDVLEKGDMWFASGDMLKQKNDESGVYYFCERIGDTFRWKGENVSTTEVENYINEIDGIVDCVVYGVEIPNQNDGKAGMAMLYLEDKYEITPMWLANIYSNLSRQLPIYSVPCFLRISRSKPVVIEHGEGDKNMTPTFKHKKNALAADGYESCGTDELFARVNEKYLPMSEKIIEDTRHGTIKF